MRQNYLVASRPDFKDFCIKRSVAQLRIAKCHATNLIIAFVMNLRLLGLIAALFALSYQSSAQLSSIYTVQNTSCHNTTDGSITFEGVEACFAPVDVVLDSTIVMSFSTLKNDGYDYINHGAGPGSDFAYSVWAGNTSVGDVYIATGIFSDSITFDTTTLYATGDQDMFTVCFDASTSGVMWATSAGAGSGTYTAGIGVTGNADKCWVVGYLEGTTAFQNDTVTVASGDGYQGFLAKYDITTGTTDSVIQIGNTGDDEVINVHYAAGRVYTIGNFNNSITLAGNVFASNGNYDPFISVYDTALTTNHWAATGGGTGNDLGNDIVAYVNGSGEVEKVFVVGEFRNTATFGSNNATSVGARDFYICGLDSSGNWMWTEYAGGTGNQDRAISIDIDSDGDRLYVGGVWGNTMTLGTQNLTASGSADGFISYLDTAGNVDSTYVFSSSSFDQVIDLQSIDDDYLVFVGQFGNTVNFADSAFTSNGQGDAFLGKIGPDQHEIWGKNFGAGNNDAWNSVRIGPNERVHTAGFFVGDASAYQAGLVSAGSEDAVVTNGVFTGTADTLINLTGLAGGDYYVVMSDSNGNTIIDTITVMSPDSIELSAFITNASSGSATDGAIDLTVTGGTPGYTYSWSNTATTEDLTGLGMGTYTVTVTDTNGCTAIDSFVIDTGLTTLAFNGIVTDLICGGDSSGAINIVLLGGSAPFSYMWNTGDTTQDLTGIGGGTYTITVTDADTSIVDSFTVYEPPVLNVNGVITPPTSGSSNDGAVDLTVSGGIPGYTYQWSTSDTTEDISGLGIGMYTVTVTDSIGCMKVLTFDVDTLPELTVVLLASDVTCLNTNNGTIDLTVIGGVPPYTYSWSNSATTEDISGLAPGTYTVTVTDSVAQTATGSETVGSNPQYPDPIVGPITGPTSAQAWTTFNYSVPTTNGSNFDWSANGGMVTAAASNACTIQWNAGPDGVVYVGETDANGCYAIDSQEVNILFVGISETHENTIQVYPNPASDQLTIALPDVFSTPGLVIHDVTGRMVTSARIESSMHQLMLTNFKSGVYFMTLSTEEGVIRHKFVVE